MFLGLFVPYSFTSTDVARFQTSFWWHHAAITLGEKQLPRPPIWFAKNFPRPRTEPEADLSNWKKYKWAKSSATRYHGFHPVEAVEKKFPGTRSIFDLLFWQILRRKSISKSIIEHSILSTGNRTFASVGTFILDDDFQNRSLEHKVIQTAKLAFLEGVNGFEGLQLIVLMLGWADKDGNLKLWNELCDFYYSMLPSFITDESILLRFKLLDIVDDYAQRRTMVRFSKPILQERSWSQNFDEISKYYAIYYANCFTKHDVFFAYKIPDEIRIWWANLLATVVCKEENHWQSGRELWKPAGGLLLNMLNKKVIQFRRQGLLRRIISSTNNEKIIFPENTAEIKLALEEMATIYLENPQTTMFDYKIRLAG